MNSLVNFCKSIKRIVFLVLLFSFFITQAQDRLEIYQRAKISFNQESDLYRLQELDIPADHGIKKKDHFIISDFSVSELERARINGFQVDVLIEDMRAHNLEQNRQNVPYIQRNATCNTSSSGVTYPTPSNFNLGSLGGYMTYQEFLDELDDMHDLYPNLITARDGISDFLTEGQSDNSVTPSIGGNRIEWVKISDNPNDSSEGEAQILYTSIHHAREFATLSELIFYMWYLLENYDTDAEIQSIVNNTELYFVPVVNPDGYLYNQVLDPTNGQGFWRKNRKNGNGVDNNRNYDYHINGDSNNGSWGGPGASSNPSSETYHGPSAFSEVENQAIKWFVEQHNFVIALNNHSFGRLLYRPFGYADVATADEALYINIGDELTSQNGYNSLRDSPFAGDSDDFMYGTVGTHDKIFAFTPEVNNSFYPPSNQIEDIAREMMFMNLTAAKMTNNFGTLSDRSPLFVDNSTSNAAFNLRRLGINGSGDFTVSVNPISSNITAVGTPMNFSGLNPLEDQDGTIDYTLSSSIAVGDDVIYELVVNNGSFDTSITISKIFGEAEQVFFDNGDSSTANFENNDWGISNVLFESTPTSITDSPGGNYANDENSSITLNNTIDLTNALSASVSFYASWDIEDTWDYVQFEISTNNGNTWIPQCGNFTTEGTNIQPTGEPLYDGTQSGFVLEEISLSDYLGEEILARFQLVSDDQVTRDGFYFDDLEFLVVNIDSCPTTTTYTSSGWDNGVPTDSVRAIIDEDYDTADGNITACALIINTGTTLTVAAGDFISVLNDITVDGTLTILHEGSVVQINEDAETFNNGNISVEKTTPIIDDRNYVSMSSPMSGETRDGVYGNCRAVFSIIPANFVPFTIDLMTFPEYAGAENFLDDNLDYVLPVTGSTALPSAGISQLIFPQPAPNVGDGAYTLTYTQGTLHSGTISVPITYNGPATTNNYNVLGNPYASAIDVTAFINANDAISAVYYWDHLTNPTSALPGPGSSNFSMNDISIRNAMMGIGAVNGSSMPTQFMASGQGFAIKAAQTEAASNTPVVFTNSLRVTGNNDDFRSNESVSNSSFDKLWLQITTPSYSEIKSQMAVGFAKSIVDGVADEYDNTASLSSGFDEGYDTLRLGTFISLFSTLETGEQLSIQGRETFTTQMEIPVGFSTSIETEEVYTINIDNFEGEVLENASIFLIDNVLNTITDLKEEAHTFIATKGIQPDRFLVVFEEREVLGSQSEVFNEDEIAIYPNPASNEITLDYSGNEQLQEAIIINIHGQKLQRLDLSDFDQSQRFTINTISTGVYFIQIISKEKTIVKKIIIK